MKIGLSGHQDIPPEALAYIKNGLAEIISKATDGLAGISALAPGADQLFASLILEHGGQLHVIIPCQGYETAFTEDDDRERYHLFLSLAEDVETLNYPEPSEEAYLAAGQRVVDCCDFLVAV